MAERTSLSSPSDRIPFGAWWMLTVLLSFYTLSFVHRVVISILVEPIKATLGLTDFELGLVIGPAFGISYFVFSYIFGLAADQTSRRLVIFVGITLWSLCAGFTGLATGFVLLAIFWAGVGAGEAGLTPAAFSSMADRFPPRRLATVIAIYQMGSKFGTALAYTLGAATLALATTLDHVDWPIVGRLEPWQMTLAFIGFPGVLLALLAFTFKEPARSASTASVDRRRGGAPLAPFLKAESRALLPMAVGFASITITLYSITSWTPTYMSRQFGWTPMQYGPPLSIISLLGAGSMVIKGVIVDWLYGRGMRDAHLRFFTWMLAATLPLGAVIFFLSDPWLFLISYGILQVVTLQFVVFMGATLQLFVPSDLRARVTGLFLGSFTLLGLGAGPTLTAFLTDFVFGDETKLGLSLAATNCLTIPLAWLSLRYALPRVNEALDRREAEERNSADILDAPLPA